MKHKKPRSLGELAYPSVTAVLDSRDTVVLRVQSLDKVVKIRGSGWCMINNLMAAAKSITGQQRDIAQRHWHRYLEYKKITGFDPGNGEQ